MEVHSVTADTPRTLADVTSPAWTVATLGQLNGLSLVLALAQSVARIKTG